MFVDRNEVFWFKFNVIYLSYLKEGLVKFLVAML